MRRTAVKPRVPCTCVAVLATLISTLIATASAGAIVSGPPLKLKPETLKSATATVPYKQTLAAGGGTAPYSYSVISGSLPEGLELSATGVITGTPVSAGSSTFTVEATDASSPERFATRTYALNVQLDLSPKSLHPVTAGSGLVDEELSATGGTGPYTFSVVSGELPEGLYFVEEGGSTYISGVADKAGTFDSTIAATDGAGDTGTRSYKMKVLLGISPAPGDGMPEGVVGGAYEEYVGDPGGSTDYTVEVVAGALPDGLEIVREGEEVKIVGTPTKAETASFTLLVTDLASGLSRSDAYRITVRASKFPLHTFVLEQDNHEHEPTGTGYVELRIKKESATLDKGSAYSLTTGEAGTWRYEVEAHRLDFTLTPEGEGATTTTYQASCEPIAETCSGEDGLGPFTLRRPGPVM